MPLKRTLALLAAAMLLTVAACSDDDSGGGGAGESGESGESGGGGGTTTAEARDLAGAERPEGPAGTITGPLTGGGGLLLAAAAPPDLDAIGWVEEEYAVEGTATSYASEGELPADGTFELTERDEADYRTRIVVRRPAEAADFDGTVVVEWLNVSAGFDAAPDFTYLQDELVRRGHAWVGVSAQHIGIEGGAVAVSTPLSEAAGAGKGLAELDPERYGELHHPGDAYMYDIYTQVARALREPGDVDPLGGLDPEVLLAVGESQSGFTLTTYANGVQPIAQQYDGILIHSRGSAAAPLGEPDAGIDIAGTIGGAPTTVRTDLDVPVLIFENEGDVIGLLSYLPARQDDTDGIRLWEVAGTAHADQYQLGGGGVAEAMGCPAPVNAGPQHFVLKAALRHLDTWVRTGEAPPESPRLEVEGEAFVRDENGNALGGIRTPLVDVPVDTLTGEAHPEGSVTCLLFGQTIPLPEDRLAELYESRQAYLDAFEASADEAIEAGFVLEDDRDALLDEAQPDRIPE